MSSRASGLESSKASGDAIEAEIVQAVDALEYVGDRTATWHDARTTAVLESIRRLGHRSSLVDRYVSPIVGRDEPFSESKNEDFGSRVYEYADQDRR
ncbi:hypothetical protein E2L06_01800 [Haloterrigena sp. H1]|uniref:hypothetical protein n=1 Tax=Haloterrigena sp. H1 TaxID=2552943 RepID=UPI00110DFC08|nr:hypothetical protein [Haloterrigena sp. H1]TMT85399.1 hypothetical protein E2L06_01800 [Haloterrigena sp. H1]